MPPLICKFCNYSTNRNNDFIKHQKTRKHKINKEKYDLEQEKVAEVAEKGLKRTQKGLKKDSNLEKRTQKDSKGLKKDSDSETQKYECEYCGILLKTRAIYLRHIRKFCKVKKKEQIDENSDSLLSRLKILEKEKAKLHRHIEKLIEKQVII